MDKRLEDFLKELTELSKKYGLYIGGCGCCGSPWIRDTKGWLDTDSLSFNDEKGCYTVW